tara:strand:+ start:42 stop:785 length:744 start_codon:yes stop_codon:yes gene_type:complete
MKKLLLLLTFISSFAFGQDYDYQQLCLDCAAAEGFYCGDDPANWTQYAPLGCVQTSWINDGWVDCIDASDEGDDVVPTLPLDCIPPPPLCDTVYVDIPVYIYETIFQTDTIYNTEYITQIVFDTIVEIEYETIFEEIFVTDTLWMEGALDTMFIDVIEYVDVFVFDTIVEIETEYIEFFTTDTIIEYVEIINTEYLDCDTGLPCTSNIPELLNQHKKESKLYNLLGQAIKEPNGIYIEDGQIKYELK